MTTQLAKAKQILIEAGADLSASTDLQSFLQNTQLTLSSDANSISIDQPNGKALSIPAATAVSAGILSSSDFTKLTELPTGSSITSSLADKVDKVAGKSLLDDTLVTKLTQLRDDATITADLSTKVDKVTGKELSEEDFTTVLKDKLDGLREDSVTDTLLDGKVDKVTGKDLIDPAPVDGKQYARKDDAWVEVTGGGGTGDVEEAPIDGKQYARKDAAWEEVAAGGGGGDVEEAPIDGKTYVRSDGAWAEIDYAAPVTKDFMGVDPADNGQWVPTYLDFPDTSKIYKGSVEIKLAPGMAYQYTASFNQSFGAWLVEMTFTLDIITFPLIYLTSNGLQGLVTAPLSFRISSGLPAGLRRIQTVEGRSTYDMRSILGIPTSSTYQFELEIDIEAGYADVLLETPMYSSGDIPLSSEVFQDVTDKLEDDLGLMPGDFDSLMTRSTVFNYGFTKGAKYWEVDKVEGRIPSTPYDLDAVKMTVKSASDEAHIIKFPLTFG